MELSIECTINLKSQNHLSEKRKNIGVGTSIEMRNKEQVLVDVEWKVQTIRILWMSSDVLVKPIFFPWGGVGGNKPFISVY